MVKNKKMKSWKEYIWIQEFRFKLCVYVGLSKFMSGLKWAAHSGGPHCHLSHHDLLRSHLFNNIWMVLYKLLLQLLHEERKERRMDCKPSLRHVAQDENGQDSLWTLYESYEASLGTAQQISLCLEKNDLCHKSMKWQIVRQEVDGKMRDQKFWDHGMWMEKKWDKDVCIPC